MAEKYIYSLKEGKGDMKALLGGKGALVLCLAPGFPAGSVVFQFFGVLFRNGGGQLLEGGAVKFF